MKKTKTCIKCPECKGKGIVESDDEVLIEAQMCNFKTFASCDACDGQGRQVRWVSEKEVVHPVFKPIFVK